MPEFLSLQCFNCRAAYAVPDVYRPHLEGKALLCPACRKSWVAMPSGSETDSIEPSRVDLRKFRRQSAGGPGSPAVAPTPPAAPQARPASDPSPAPWHEVGHGKTTHVATVSPPAATSLSLRVAVSGPDGNITGVFALGGKSFTIGRTSCHLRLPKAPIPDRAIEIREAEEGFIASGLDGYPLPMGSITAPSALIAPGQSVRLTLVPYSLELQTSTTPGSPLKDLPKAKASGQQSQAAPAAPVAAPGPSPGPTPPGSPSSRQQIQELAVDVRPDQNAFGGGPTSLLDEIEGDMTLTDMGAMGIHAQKPETDPFQGLEIRFERADGPQKGLAFKVTQSPLVIGRSDMGLTIKDQRVSSKHAQLDVGGPWVYTLKDLASTNGTTVNGRPISVAHLGDGDLVSFGGVSFTFRAVKK